MMNIDRSELFDLLSKVCIVIRKIYDSREILFKAISTGIKYDVTLNKPGLSYNFEVINYVLVDPTLRFSMIEEIRLTDEHISCEQYLHDHQHFGELRMFVDRVLDNIEMLSSLDRTINNFIDYISGNFEFYGEYYIDCIRLEDEHYDLIDNIRIETAKNLKFEYYFSGGGPNMDNIAEIETRIKLTDRGNYLNVINERFQNVLDALILIKAKPINLVFSLIANDSLFLRPKTDYHHNWFVGSCFQKVVLNKKDIENLISIYSRYKNFSHSDEEYIKVAMERYKDALYRDSKYEGKIAFSVASLEALFNQGKDDLKYKLCIRASQILRLFDYIPENEIKDGVFKKLKTAYGIRSDYVHGNKKIKKGMDFDKLYKEIVEINRACIVCFINILPSYKSKENLLEMLDSSLINHNDFDMMSKLIKQL